MTDDRLYRDLERFLVDRGAVLVACADLRVLPEGVRGGLPIGVCIAVGLAQSVVAQISSGPTREYFAEYQRANEHLQRLADNCAAFLRERGFRALAGMATVDDLDLDRLSTLLPHKTVATLSGLGWIGKCALLVTESHGSAVRFNTVLTDAPLPVGAPVEKSFCGDCAFCVELCPAGAVSGKNWLPSLSREDFFDAFACRRAAGQQARKIGIERTICGICIAVCPFTRRYLAAGGCLLV